MEKREIILVGAVLAFVLLLNQDFTGRAFVAGHVNNPRFEAAKVFVPRQESSGPFTQNVAYRDPRYYQSTGGPPAIRGSIGQRCEFNGQPGFWELGEANKKICRV